MIYSRAGDEGVAGFLVVVAASFVLTAVCLGLAALIAAGNIGRRRSRALALALVVWLVLVVLADLAALGAASLLRSGAASRLLITAAIVNPVGAVRTASLLLIEGTAAFGSASLALLRFAGGPVGAALLAGGLARALAGAAVLGSPPAASRAPTSERAGQYRNR